MDNTAMNQTHHMKPIAAGLASLGRGGDSMLVHMQPREVAGLQQLAMAHGGSLTINPETGLPEAGFLGDVLGAVAPIALGAFLGPGAFGIQGLGMSALGAGLTTGLLGYALTGDPLKGLMAGLGGGSGASLAGSLGAKGVVALTPEVTAVGSSATPTLAGAAANSSIIPGSTIAEKLGVEGLGQAAGSGAVSSLSTVPAAYSTQAQMAGLKEVLAHPFAKGNLMNTATLASPFLAAAAKTPPTTFPTAKEEKTPYEGPYYPTERTASFPTDQERQQLGTKEYQYFTPIHPYPGYEKYDPNYRGYAEGGDVNETPDPDSNPAEYQSGQYGAPLLNKSVGGLASFAKGGYLDGPGDGMSDSIPATIADKQPARLADGEFVVPADVVSHLGNGSTKAGAQRLYAMMDKVRKARTGTTKQGKQINPNKYMPA